MCTRAGTSTLRHLELVLLERAHHLPGELSGARLPEVEDLVLRHAVTVRQEVEVQTRQACVQRRHTNNRACASVCGYYSIHVSESTILNLLQELEHVLTSA